VKHCWIERAKHAKRDRLLPAWKQSARRTIDRKEILHDIRKNLRHLIEPLLGLSLLERHLLFSDINQFVDVVKRTKFRRVR
jgi:hypothetical protein